MLVSHDKHLIDMSCNAVWLCKDKLVHRLEGGLAQYKKMSQSLNQLSSNDKINIHACIIIHNIIYLSEFIIHSYKTQGKIMRQ